MVNLSFLMGVGCILIQFVIDDLQMVNVKSLWNGFLGARLRELLIMEECLIRLCSLSPLNFVIFILLLLHGYVSQSLALRKFLGVFGNRHRNLEAWSESCGRRLSRRIRLEYRIALTGRGLFLNSVLFPFLCFVSV